MDNESKPHSSFEDFLEVREVLQAYAPMVPGLPIHEGEAAMGRIEEQLEARPSRAEVEKRVEWWITDFHFKPPEVTTDAYWRMMAREIAEYAVPNPASRDGS